MSIKCLAMDNPKSIHVAGKDIQKVYCNGELIWGIENNEVIPSFPTDKIYAHYDFSDDALITENATTGGVTLVKPAPAVGSVPIMPKNTNKNPTREIWNGTRKALRITNPSTDPVAEFTTQVTLWNSTNVIYISSGTKTGYLFMVLQLDEGTTGTVPLLGYANALYNIDDKTFSYSATDLEFAGAYQGEDNFIYDVSTLDLTKPTVLAFKIKAATAKRVFAGYYSAAQVPEGGRFFNGLLGEVVSICGTGYSMSTNELNSAMKFLGNKWFI